MRGARNRKCLGDADRGRTVQLVGTDGRACVRAAGWRVGEVRGRKASREEGTREVCEGGSFGSMAGWLM